MEEVTIMRASVAPQPSFADFELQSQGIAQNKTLDAISDLLDRHGLEPCTADASFEHRVDHAITRDLVVAVKSD